VTTRLTGRLKFYNEARRFGFVAGDDGVDYFFHQAALGERQLDDSVSSVEFEAQQTPRGPKAIEVWPL
jgi:CspA family cold shock protein